MITEKPTHTPGSWTWEDVPGAGLQIRGPYENSTRLLFSDIWRAFPESRWDAEMLCNARLAAAAPDMLKALRFALADPLVSNAVALVINAAILEATGELP